MQNKEAFRIVRYLILTLAIISPLVSRVSAAPRIILVSPQQGQIISGKNVDVSVSYDTRSEEPVTRIELEIDSEIAQHRDLKEPRSRGICSFLINAEDYSSGKHTSKVKLFSNDTLLGFVSGTIEVASRPTDITPPVIEFLNVQSGQLCSGESEIVVQATDDSGEPPLVSLSIDNSVMLIKNNPPYIYVWDTTMYDDGVYLIEAWAVDAAGNQALTEAIHITVRNQIEDSEPAQDDTTDVIAAAESIADTVEQTAAPEDISPTPVYVEAVEELAASEELIAEGKDAPELEQAGKEASELISTGKTLGPLVEFIEPENIVEEPDSHTKKPESIPTPTVKAVPPSPETKHAPVSIEIPTLGLKLAAPEQLIPTASPTQEDTKTENP